MSYNAKKKQIAKDALQAIQHIYEIALEVKERRRHYSLQSNNLYIHLEKTLKQPISASVSVLDDKEQEKTIYITRGETFSDSKYTVASYRAPIGRLVALDVGDCEYIQLPNREEEYEVLQKNEFIPFKQNNTWDSEAKLFFKDSVFYEQSIRKLADFDSDIEERPETIKINTDDTLQIKDILLRDTKLTKNDIPEVDDTTQITSLYPKKKITVSILKSKKKVLLPESNIIDANQEHEDIKADEQPSKLKKEIISSMSLRDKPILDKVQDNIFRLSPRSQIVLMGPPGTGKTTTLIKKLGLHLDEEYSEIKDDKSWYMFTPTELLKNYLKEAFNREGIAAPDKNVFIWKNFIRFIARDVLSILKTPTGKSGNLILIDNEQLLKSESKFQQSIYNLFFQWMNQKIISDNQSDIKNMCDDIILKSQSLTLTYITEYICKRIDLIVNLDQIKIITLMQNISDLVQYLKNEQTNLRKENHIGDKKQIHENNLELINQIVDCITNVHKNINPNNYFNKISEKYIEFRNEHSEFYINDIEKKNISYSELDIIVLSYFNVYNEFTKRNMLNARLQVCEKIHNIQRTQVFVDEITDFSAVQLAIMFQLFSNDYKTFVGAGDFNQRITNNGISTKEELSWAIPNVSIQNIKIPYRQSKQLYEFSQKLIDCYDDNFEQPKYLDIEGLYPVVGYRMDNLDNKAQWLTERICEIERQIEDKLPSIAILVNEEKEIEPLAECLNQYLQEYNIQVDPCLRGQVLGYENNIRIFSIDYIKGLEFEAAFFMDVDIFAKNRPSTFNRFLYVGTSRAATYLGLTVTGNTLPKKLSNVENILLENWETEGI